MMNTSLADNSSSLRSSISSVPLLDVSRDNQPLMEEILEAINNVCHSGRFVGGPDCQQLEQTVAQRCSAAAAVGCASGSDALLVSLMALGIEAGDEVIVPSFTFFATASAVWRLGAKPVFVDIEPVTFNIDPALVEQAITPRTKAMIPVHLFGQCAQMKPLMEIARRHQLSVIEDAAQAIGAKCDEQLAGGMGDVGCFSFYPTKNLGGFGDGGMMTTNDAELAKQLRLYANHGMQPRYYHDVVGVNSRLDSIQAAVLNIKIAQLESWESARRQNAAQYDDMLRQAGLDSSVVLPETNSNCVHVWNQYTIRIPNLDRDMIRARLAEANVGTEIYYPVPLHQQQCFQSLQYGPGSLPETEKAAGEVLSLPIFPGLTAQEQEYVVDQLGRVIGELKTPRRAAS